MESCLACVRTEYLAWGVEIALVLRYALTAVTNPRSSYRGSTKPSLVVHYTPHCVLYNETTRISVAQVVDFPRAAAEDMASSIRSKYSQPAARAFEAVSSSHW
jgi:hypothetical protein